MESLESRVTVYFDHESATSSWCPEARRVRDSVREDWDAHACRIHAGVENSLSCWDRFHGSLV